MLKQPLMFDNFMPNDLYEAVRGEVRHAPLSYGHKSSSKTDPFGHLAWKPVHDKQKNLADLHRDLGTGPLFDCWKYLSGKDLFRGAKLIRCYANGYTYGMDGYFHTDSDREGEITIILYMCDRWDPDWAGETVIIDGTGKHWSVPPKPNRALIIPSNMQHCARAVSRLCREMRMVLVFKTRPPRSQNFERLSEWLKIMGALEYDHQKGSLHDHLVRVFSMLEQRSLLPSICFGGGLHSIYGTNAFKKRLVSPEPHVRADVADFFSPEAENLAYTFSLIDRPKCLEAPFSMTGQLPTSYGTGIVVDALQYHSLRLIEAANLADQDSLGKWTNLYAAWHGKLPDRGRSDPKDQGAEGRQAP